MPINIDELDEVLSGNERDVGTLVRHGRLLLTELKQARARIKELEAPPPADDSPRAAFIRENAGRLEQLKAGTPEYQAEFDKIMAEMEPFLEQEVSKIRDTHVAQKKSLEDQYVSARRNAEAQTLVRAIGLPDSDEALLPHVRDRIHVERSGDEWTVGAKDAGGAVRDLAWLKEDLRADPSLRRLLRGVSQEERDAHQRRVNETLGVPNVKTVTRRQFDGMSHEARSRYLQTGAGLADGADKH